uniref:Uncharacterized protein n=1 Tax=Oryza sativa subsp. japonica TaxID=39947 RepID=Q6K3P8_ORYSJ|nr:hypothetical protein [Oryza sativa Japonica Group]
MCTGFVAPRHHLLVLNPRGNLAGIAGGPIIATSQPSWSLSSHPHPSAGIFLLFFLSNERVIDI